MSNRNFFETEQDYAEFVAEYDDYLDNQAYQRKVARLLAAAQAQPTVNSVLRKNNTPDTNTMVVLDKNLVRRYNSGIESEIAPENCPTI